MKYCPFCKTQIDFTIGRTTVCPSCKKELHSCRCCEYYSPGNHWDCRESIEEPVTDKERGNFCDSFVLAKKEIANHSSDKSAEARKKLEALFG